MKYSYILSANSSFNEIIAALDEAGVGFLALVNELGKLEGVITDGDVRRAVLNKKEDLGSVVNENPHTMLEGSSEAEIIFNLKRLHRRHMPIVDKENTLIKVFALDDVDFFQRENYVVIMAGGLGSRLGELTNDTPKPMIHVGGKPMLLHIIELMREQGFYKFLLCVNYKKEKIKNYFKNGKHLGVNIEYIEERDRLGTAGALSLIDKDFNMPFVVMNADVITNLDFGQLLDSHGRNGSVATMCLRQYSEKIPFGVVETDANGSVSAIKEKPEYTFNVNAGIYVLNNEVLRYIPDNQFFDMPSLFDQLLSEKILCGTYSILGYWMDLGRKEDLDKAEKDMIC
ncbi:MAG: nucleotidyltransferase family protein [Amphritea sp.]|nr:nucleotidyltransferase family protein [Amphritea sp.]